MLMLKIVGVIVALAVVIIGLIVFDLHVEEKFRHRFFTMGKLIAIVASSLMIVIGYKWHVGALETHADPLNGWVVLGIGAAVLIGITIHNVIKTSVLYGLFGSLIQLPIFAAVGFLGIPILIGWGILCGIGAAMTPTVRVVK